MDLPEAETPVMTLNLPRGMSTDKDLRLCSLALTMRMAFDAAPQYPLRRLGETRCRFCYSRSELRGAGCQQSSQPNRAGRGFLTPHAPPIAAACSRSARPVWRWRAGITSSGVPKATTSPPASPPSGPQSQ